MALPAAAVIQATVSTYLTRHEVVESELTREDEIAGAQDTPDPERQGRSEEGIFGRLSSRWRREGT